MCEHVYTGLIGTIRVILVYEADDFYLLKVFFNENVIHISILFLNLFYVHVFHLKKENQSLTGQV